MVEEIVEIQQRRVPLVIRVQIFERVKLLHKTPERQIADPAADPLIGLPASTVVALTGRAEMFPLSGAPAHGLGGVLPFAFPPPLFEVDFILLAGFGGS